MAWVSADFRAASCASARSGGWISNRPIQQRDLAPWCVIDSRNVGVDLAVRASHVTERRSEAQMPEPVELQRCKTIRRAVAAPGHRLVRRNVSEASKSTPAEQSVIDALRKVESRGGLSGNSSPSARVQPT